MYTALFLLSFLPLLASHPPSPKVKELELALDTRRQLSEGRSLEPITETEKEALRRDICEQENLLQGYQKACVCMTCVHVLVSNVIRSVEVQT